LARQFRGTDPENRETMVAETRLGPCIECV
jgi:hypothetical protein